MKNKIKITISIDPELHQFLKTQVGNTSKYLSLAVKERIKKTNTCIDLVNRHQLSKKAVHKAICAAIYSGADNKFDLSAHLRKMASQIRNDNTNKDRRIESEDIEFIAAKMAITGMFNFDMYDVIMHLSRDYESGNKKVKKEYNDASIRLRKNTKNK
jgi:hypothetical protein